MAKIVTDCVRFAKFLKELRVTAVINNDRVFVVNAGGVRDGFLFIYLFKSKIGLRAQRFITPLVLSF
jgi:hypothetical protein